MGYMHIENLYKNQDIFLFKECYALEKIHGTSAHIQFHDGQIKYFSGGSNYENFKQIFINLNLESKMVKDMIIYGEAYGGKMQGMSDTYGKNLKFIAFDVMINKKWLNVPMAKSIVEGLGLEFVPYNKISTEIEAINQERDSDSIVAINNGMGAGKKREGVVLRPLIEIKKNNGERIMAKHKRDDFRETKTKREIDPNKFKILSEASEIAEEWVTPMRLEHVLQRIENKTIENICEILDAMQEDVLRESKGEIILSKEAIKAIRYKTAYIFKERLKNKND